MNQKDGYTIQKINWVESIGDCFFNIALFMKWNNRSDITSKTMKIVPWISGIWKSSIERKAIAHKNIVSILLKQKLCLSLFILSQIFPPVIKKGRVREYFLELLLFGRLLLVLDLCFWFSFLLWFLFGWRLFCSLSVFLFFQHFLDGILLFLKGFEHIVWTNVRDQE